MRLAKKLALTTAGFFTASIIATPALAFAELTHNGNNDNSNSSSASTRIPARFKSKEACIEDLSGRKLSQIRNYGEARLRARDRAVTKLERQVEKIKVKNDRSRGSVDNANRQALAKSIPAVELIQPKDVKADLEADVKKAREDVNTAREALKKNDKAAVAEAVCTLIFDTNIFSYLQNKFVYLATVAELHNQNAANAAKYAEFKKKARPAQLEALNAKLADPVFDRIPSQLKSRIAEAEIDVQNIQNDDDFTPREFKEAVKGLPTIKQLKKDATAIKLALKRVEKRS